MIPRTILAIGALALAVAPAAAQGTKADYERANSLAGRARAAMVMAAVDPLWLSGAPRFWYRADRAGGVREYLLVDAESGKRGPAFDHAQLAAALTKATGREASATRLPIDRLEIHADGSLLFTARGKSWRYDTKDGLRESKETPPAQQRFNPRRRFQRPTAIEDRSRERSADRSPDGKWSAFVKDHNLYLRDRASGTEFPLSKEGTADDGYLGQMHWSPDSKKLVVFREKKGETHLVYEVESSPRDRVQPKLHSFPYYKPGDRLPIDKPHLFDIESRKEISVADELFPNPYDITRLRWAPDSREFTFVYNQRGHQVLRVVGVDAATGKARAVVDERSKTFVDYAQKQFLYFLDTTGELIWMSERNGWNHLYLYDRYTSSVKYTITHGAWVVRGVDRVDEKARQIWFRASGIVPGEDPYFVHYCRVNFDGTGLVRLTDGDGMHSVQWSPDRRFFIDRWSRVDLPPITVLRRGSDGKQIRELERADWSALLKTGWKAPERFVAKGRDGKTDIYGVIYRPTTFDPKKKYPVIEQIYAGPQSSYVPKAFQPFYGPQAIAELGFILVQIDGMGTSNRSKAFHDVCWKNLGDAGLPDRILWMKAAAAKYPYVDLTRVGVYGGSAGGQNALGALLFHGEFYKVGVADCGCHDNRMDKVWWNELWMGWPVGPEYAEQSNVTQAHRLQGKLFLIVGELDHNVDPASTMQVVNALVKANKDFDLLVVPGGAHGAGGSLYGRRRQMDFFVRNLLGVEPRR